LGPTSCQKQAQTPFSVELCCFRTVLLLLLLVSYQPSKLLETSTKPGTQVSRAQRLLLLLPTALQNTADCVSS
jgi:hypothetical protein